MNLIDRIDLIKECYELLIKIEKNVYEIDRLNELKNILGYINHNDAVLKDYLPFLINKLNVSDGVLNISGDAFVMDEAKVRSVYYITPTQQLSDDERYLVHCTNYFPNNHIIKCLYDGKKTYKDSILVNGAKKEVEYLYHRHTTHYVSNAVVQNTGDGNNWDCVFVVIEPYLGHENDIYNKGFSDTFSNGSLKLSEKAVILIRKDVVEHLTEEQLTEYNYVIFDGDFRNALQNYLVFNNIKMVQVDRNNACHRHSCFYYMEGILKIRDICLNYVKNNIYDGKALIRISVEEFVEIIDIFKENFSYFDHEFHFEGSVLNDYLLAFLYSSGFILNSDNTFSIMSEDEILDRFLNHNVLSSIDMEKLIKMQAVYNNYIMELEKKKNEEIEIQEEINEAYYENDILSTKVKDLKFINISQLNYANYIKKEFKKMYPSYSISFKNHGALINYDEELDLDLESISQYVKDYDIFLIKFDLEKTVLENIKDCIISFAGIIEQIERMKKNDELEEANITL